MRWISSGARGFATVVSPGFAAARSSSRMTATDRRAIWTLGLVRWVVSWLTSKLVVSEDRCVPDIDVVGAPSKPAAPGAGTAGFPGVTPGGATAAARAAAAPTTPAAGGVAAVDVD